MTIEGLRADMTVAQRKFELERLFVPLKLFATPPEISHLTLRRARPKALGMGREEQRGDPVWKCFHKE